MNRTRNKGFTLVEVIVALAIIGIVAVSFLAVLSTNFKFMQRNKQITADAFTMQKEMETAIEGKKKSTLTNLVLLNNVFENGVHVKVEQLTYVKDSKKIYTLISETRLPALPVPKLTSVSATLRTNGVAVTQAYAVNTTDVLGSYVLDASTAPNFMVNTYYWYVSRAGFNMPVTSSPLEMEMSTKYPRFPNDYQIITTSTTNTLNNVADFAGKHVIFTATPASKAGKLGQMVISSPVFISGLPELSSNLLLHLDGSIISPQDLGQTQLDGTGTKTVVSQWRDYSQFNKPAIQTNVADMPTLVEQPIAGDFVGRYVDYTIGKTQTVTHTGVQNKNITVFAIVKGNATNNVFVNGNYTLLAAGSEIGNGWRLVKASYHSNSNSIVLGDNPLSVAEVILYQSSLTTGDEAKITEYFTKKYAPVTSIGQINSLNNLTDSIIQNRTYTPPLAVLAKMAYGSDQYVPVRWSGTINTSTVGTFTLTGEALADTTKTCTLTVTVLPPIAVTSVMVSPTSYNLPIGIKNTLVATVNPIDAENKSVTWLSSQPSIATVDSLGVVTAVGPGNVNITVKTSDGNYTAVSTVTVPSYSAIYEFVANNLNFTGININLLTTPNTGIVQGTINNTNAYLLSPVGQNIDAVNAKKIRVRMATNGGGAVARLEYRRSSIWYYKDFPINNNGQFQEIEINMVGESNWSGTVTQLRIYPSLTAVSGNVSIDYIRISD